MMQNRLDAFPLLLLLLSLLSSACMAPAAIPVLENDTAGDSLLAMTEPPDDQLVTAEDSGSVGDGDIAPGDGAGLADSVPDESADFDAPSADMVPALAVLALDTTSVSLDATYFVDCPTAAKDAISSAGDGAGLPDVPTSNVDVASSATTTDVAADGAAVDASDAGPNDVGVMDADVLDVTLAAPLDATATVPPPAPCKTVAECPSGNGYCAFAKCVNGFCQMDILPVGTHCNGGDPCYGTFTCQADHWCKPAPPYPCPPSTQCTTVTCTWVAPHDSTFKSAQCTAFDPSRKASPTSYGCNDGNPCTTDDKCVSGQCTGLAWLSCDDGNTCTADSCVPAKGCQHIPIAATCGNGAGCGTCQDGVCTASQAAPVWLAELPTATVGLFNGMTATMDDGVVLLGHKAPDQSGLSRIQADGALVWSIWWKGSAYLVCARSDGTFLVGLSSSTAAGSHLGVFSAQGALLGTWPISATYAIEALSSRSDGGAYAVVNDAPKRLIAIAPTGAIEWTRQLNGSDSDLGWLSAEMLYPVADGVLVVGTHRQNVVWGEKLNAWVGQVTAAGKLGWIAELDAQWPNFVSLNSYTGYVDINSGVLVTGDPGLLISQRKLGAFTKPNQGLLIHSLNGGKLQPVAQRQNFGGIFPIAAALPNGAVVIGDYSSAQVIWLSAGGVPGGDIFQPSCGAKLLTVGLVPRSDSGFYVASQAWGGGATFVRIVRQPPVLANCP